MSEKRWIKSQQYPRSGPRLAMVQAKMVTEMVTKIDFLDAPKGTDPELQKSIDQMKQAAADVTRPYQSNAEDIKQTNETLKNSDDTTRENDTSKSKSE